MNEKMKEIMIQLEKGVREIYSDDRFKDYLNIVSRLHSYSPANTILIALQNPNATLVAGFDAWKKMDRYVKKGEHGIRIICPMIRKNAKDEDEIFAYKPGYVYDITQTGGHDVPSYIVDMLKGKVDDFDTLVEAINNCTPASIEFVDMSKKSYVGQYDAKKNTIQVSANVDELQQIKTLIHEAAHCLLYKSDKKERKDTAQREIEAEGTAYAVCCWLGLDVSEYSFKYVALWSAERKNSDLKDSLNAISRTTDEIINGIQEYIKIKEVETK